MLLRKKIIKQKKQQSDPVVYYIAISGQLRTFVDSFRKNLEILCRKETSLYLDAWRSVGATFKRYPAYKIHCQLKKHFDPFVYSWVQNGNAEDVVQSVQAETLNFCVFDNIYIDRHDTIIDHIDAAVADKIFELEQPYKNMAISTMSMYYRMAHSFSAIDRGNISDISANQWVVRIRPDYVLRKDILFLLESKYKNYDLVFFDSTMDSECEWEWGYVADSVFAFKHKHLKWFCKIFQSHFHHIKSDGFKKFPEAHPQHGHYLIGESFLSYFLRDWRKDKKIGIELNSGYINREIDSNNVKRSFSLSLLFKQFLQFSLNASRS